MMANPMRTLELHYPMIQLLTGYTPRYKAVSPRLQSGKPPTNMNITNAFLTTKKRYLLTNKAESKQQRQNISTRERHIKLAESLHACKTKNVKTLNPKCCYLNGGLQTIAKEIYEMTQRILTAVKWHAGIPAERGKAS